MKTAIGIWTVRADAEPLARFLATHLPAELPPDIGSDSETNRERFARVFPLYSGWVLLMTTGIAVRYLQGLLENKKSDPGVVVLDEAARFAVSLVGGHEGGANRLAYRIANLVGAVPVISTAIEALKPLVLGIGCRKGVSEEQINVAVTTTLHSINRTLTEVREVATVDLKLHEPGLVAWCETHALPLRSIHRETIKNRAWVTHPSSWVKENLGLDGVCEPAALIACPRGQLIQPKTALNGVTVAIVEDTGTSLLLQPDLSEENA
jgi:cobalt-precorrin 5A hydrolase